MSKVVIEKYLEKHDGNYIGKYRRHSSVLIAEQVYKFRYYIRDIQYREISVFVTIDCSETVIKYEFSMNLHEQEKEYIVKDALQTILYFLKYKKVLDARVFKEYIENGDYTVSLEPLDYRNLLDYLEYHQGTNQQTIDTFYSFFMPYLERLFKRKEYKKVLDSCNLLLDKILYEFEWDGDNAKYLDIQYQFHLYYFRKLIVMIYKHLDSLFKHNKNRLLEAIHRLCDLPRFTFAIITDFEPLVFGVPRATKTIIDYFQEKIGNDSLVVRYLLSIYNSNDEAYREANLDILRFVMKDMLTFANHDLQLAMGNAIVVKEGYDILIHLFAEDYNTFVFVCFPISTFPDEYRKVIREELEKAIRFYAARMEHDEYRLSSFEQVANINRLLMENYKEYGRCGK